LSLHWKKMNKQGALAGMLTGAFTVLFWIYAPITIGGQSLSSLMYEIVPGFILATVAIVVVSKITAPPEASVEKMFDDMVEQHNNG